MTALKASETRATTKYMYVGQAFVCLAQAVRETVPVAVDTSLKLSRVAMKSRNVMAMGTKTASESTHDRRWDITRSLRMRDFRTCTMGRECQNNGIWMRMLDCQKLTSSCLLAVSSSSSPLFIFGDRYMGLKYGDGRRVPSARSACEELDGTLE